MQFGSRNASRHALGSNACSHSASAALSTSWLRPCQHLRIKVVGVSAFVEMKSQQAKAELGVRQGASDTGLYGIVSEKLSQNPTRRRHHGRVESLAGTASLIRNRVIKIDNLASERTLRGVAIGRRNDLCACGDSGGDRMAAVYSIIGAVKLNGVKPEAWLRHVLTQLAGHLSTTITS